MKKLLRILLLVVLALYFTACGGGGGGGGSSDASAPTTTTSTTTTTTSSTTTTDTTTTTVTTTTSTTTTTLPAAYAFGGGTGTIGSPYIVQNATDVQHIKDFPAAYFWLNNNVNMAGISFQPIASFSGVFYGNNYELDNLTINLAVAGTASFIQSLSGTLVSLKLFAVSISGLNYASGFAGNITASGLISGSSISGNITSPSGGNGFNTGTGNPTYVSKNPSGSVVTTTQNVTFNGNHVTASF